MSRESPAANQLISTLADYREYLDEPQCPQSITTIDDGVHVAEELVTSDAVPSDIQQSAMQLKTHLKKYTSVDT